MEGIALSALTLVALCVPGLILYYRYLRAAASWETSGSNEALTPQIIIAAVIGSLAFHSIWGISLQYTPWPVNYPAIFSVLTDQPAEHLYLDSPLFILQSTGYLYSQCAVAWFLGAYIGRIAEEKTDWSKTIALNSNGSVWHRLLLYPSDQGQEFEGPILTLTHSEAGKTYLYRGVLFEYQLDPSGRLVRLVLSAAWRRDFPTDRDAMESQEDEGHWIPMVGEHFVINCENIDTIEVDYVWLIPEQKNTAREKTV